MTGGICSVLFLCTGNSARSIMAEAALAREGEGRFRTFSAGSHPVGAVNPYALDLLRRNGYRIHLLRSKSWDEFAGPDAPPLDVVITVCDAAAGEVCPIWPGRPVTAHWSFPDPAAFRGSPAEIAECFEKVYLRVLERVRQLVAVPVAELDRMSLQKHLSGLDPADN